MNSIFKTQAYIFEGQVGALRKNTPTVRIYTRYKWVRVFVWDNPNKNTFPIHDYCEIMNNEYEVEQKIAELIGYPEKLIKEVENGFLSIKEQMKDADEYNRKRKCFEPKKLHNKNHKMVQGENWDLRIVFYGNKN